MSAYGTYPPRHCRAIARCHAVMARFSLASPPQNECLYSSDIPAGVRYLHIKLVAKELPAQVTGGTKKGRRGGTGRQILGWGRVGRGLRSFLHRSRAGGNQEGHVQSRDQGEGLGEGPGESVAVRRTGGRYDCTPCADHPPYFFS